MRREEPAPHMMRGGLFAFNLRPLFYPSQPSASAPASRVPPTTLMK